MRSAHTNAHVLRLLACVVFLSSTIVSAYEGGSREEVDAGVHVPQLTRAPELLEFVEADYPAEAAREGKTASVVMTLTIDAGGGVSDVQVMEPVGHGFDEAAVAAVKRFRFSPAEVDHVPAPVAIEYVYHFTLSEPETAPDAGVPEPPPTATLTGRIQARGSRDRVPNATVRCGDRPESPETLSGEDGEFTLTVPAGECAVLVVAVNYEKFQTTEVLAPGERTEVIYHLMPKAIGYETVVRGEREKKEVVRRTLERQELQKVPGSFGDPVRVIQNLPGVARAPFISGQLIVRGAAPDQTQTLLDGVEIPLLYHLGGGPSVVNAEFLDRVDFFPGGFGARYGRAVGGVVEVATRKGARDTVHGSLKIDLLDTGFFVESPVGKDISVAAAARRSYVDALLPLVLPEDPEGGTLLVLPRYWDYQVRADFGARPSLEQIAKGASTYYVMAFGSDDQLSVVASGGGRNRDLTLDFQTLFHRVKGDWTYRKGNFTSVFAPFAGYDLASAEFGEIGFDGRIFSTGAREDLTLEVSERLTLRAGADLAFEHAIGTGEIPSGFFNYVTFPGAEPELDTEPYFIAANTFDGALYTELDLKLGPVTVTPGLRATYARVSGEDMTAVDPRFFARYQLSEATQLKGSAGLYSQTPDALNMEPAPFGTPGLLFERAFQGALGVEQRVTDVVSVDLTGYYNRRFDLVARPGRRLRNENGTFTNELYANSGLGRAYGLEVMVRHDITDTFFGWLAYTLNRSEFRRAAVEGVSGTEYNFTSYDQTHILTAVGSYRLPFGFEFGARFRYVTGRPTTPLDHQGDLYGVDGNSYFGQYGPTFSARFRDFHQLDLRLDKNFVFQSWTLNAYVDVQNVYNAQNVEATFTDYRFRTTVDVPGIPVLPVVGVKGSF